MQVLKGIVPEPTQPGAAAEDTPLDHQQLLFSERFLEFAVDLLSQLPTRRFVRTLLDDRALLVKCRLSGLFGHQQGALVEQRAELARLQGSACYLGGSTSTQDLHSAWLPFGPV